MLSANAVALTKCIKRPCMVYEEPLKKSALQEVKLSEVIDDIKKTKECAIFDGTTEIEGLLYAEERFRKVARQLQFVTGEELYDNFEEILRETAEEHWTHILDGAAGVARTPATFENHLREFYNKYVDDDARNQMFKYVAMLKKPRNASPSDHVNRMTTLLRYSNKLPGTDPEKTEDQIKEIIFDSFPMDWQAQFNRSGRVLANQTMAQVLQFMRDEKNYKDNEDKKKTGTPSTSQNSNNKRKNNNNNNGGRFDKKKGRSNPCKYHAGHHDWKDCIFNPRSRNFKPDRQRPQLERGPPRQTNGQQTTPQPNRSQGGYRQGPHYYNDPKSSAPSYMYLPPAPSAPPGPPPTPSSIPSDVSWNSYHTNSTASSGAGRMLLVT